MDGAKRLYYFLRFDSEGVCAAQLDRMGEEKFLRQVIDTASRQLGKEGYPVPADAQPVPVLPKDWVGDLESLRDTSIQLLLESIEWYFRSGGRECRITPFAWFETSDKVRQFFLGYPAVTMLPVWAEEREPAGQSPAEAPAEKLPEPTAPQETEEEEAAPLYGSNASENQREQDEGEGHWRDVYVFISSTFNDMHAERNYLVKRVFPELNQWCAKRRLRLRDIDLRWGITEEDSAENLRTVQICLENIDRCRPFFLCFIGQRRGWIPADSDISPQTFREFPKLRGNLGKSVTEMEVVHSIIDPMRSGRVFEPDRLTRAFFYLRDPGYLENVRLPALRRVYTNEGSDDPQRDDMQLREFRENTLPGTGRPCRTYGCRWDENGSTPELSAVRGAPPEITHGRVTDFVCGGAPLCDRIIADMKAAITERYCLQETPEEGTPLQQELEAQAQFLHATGEAFIERAGDLDPFEAYVLADHPQPLILAGSVGSGKTSLLAHWIQTSRRQIVYRFVGRSLRANGPAELAYSVWQQLFEAGRVKAAPPQETTELLDQFGDMLGEAARERGLILVIDAIDQFPGRVWDASFLPQRLSPGVKMILSVKEDSPGADLYLREAASYARIVRTRPFSSLKDRRALAEAYLSNYLKKLSDSQMDALVRSPGAENPLYLKIVLNELRVFGEYDTLKRHIEEDFGDTALSAFSAMLARLESDPDCDGFSMKALAPRVFGWLAHARNGLAPRELAALLVQNGAADNEETARDAVYVLLRQLRPFLTEREQRADFFYDSFRLACAERYTAEKPAEKWHGELAAYLLSQPRNDRHRLMELAWQLFMAGEIPAYMDCVFDWDYFSGRLEQFGIQALIEDYRLSPCADTRRMAGFLGLAGTVLTESPDQAAARLHGHFPDDDPSLRIRALRRAAREAQKGPWLRPLINCFETPRADDERIIESREKFNGAVLFRDGALAASIQGGSSIGIWNLETGALQLRISAPEGRWFFWRIARTPDGKKLAALLNDGRVLVYETAGFTLIADFRVGDHTPTLKEYGISYFRTSFFVLSPDGRALLMMDQKQKIRAFDLADGRLLCETAYRWDVNKLCISENGLLAVANIHPQAKEDRFDLVSFHRVPNPVYLFRFDAAANTLTPAGGPLGEWRSTVEAVALSPDGGMLAGADGTQLCVYDTRTGRQLAQLPEGEVRSLQFLPGRGLLLAAGRRLILYDLKDLHPVREENGLGYINDLQVSADENAAAAEVAGKRLRLISLTAESSSSRAAMMPLRSVCPAPDGEHIYASGYPNWIQQGMQRTATMNADPYLFFFHRDGVYAGRTVLLGRDNRDFTYLAPDGTCAVSKQFQDQSQFVFRHWPLPESPTPDMEPPLPDTFLHSMNKALSYVNPMKYQFSADRRHIVIHTGYSDVTVYRARTGRQLGQIRLLPPGGTLSRLLGRQKDGDELVGDPAFDVSEDGTTLYALLNSRLHPRLERYDIKTGKRLSSAPLATKYSKLLHLDYENWLCRAVDGGRQLMFVNGEEAVLLDVATGKELMRLNREAVGCAHQDYFAACTADGRYLALTGRRANSDANARLQLWDTARGEKIGEFVADGGIGEVLFEQEGGTLLFGMENGRLCRLRSEGTGGKNP